MKISDDPSVQAHYQRMIRRGESHSMAEMLALRSPPGHQDGDLHLPTIGERFKDDPGGLRTLRRKAAKAGITVDDSDSYCASLAQCPLDPNAILKRKTARQQLAKAANDLGVGCEQLGIKPTLRSSPKTVKGLHPEVVEDEYDKRVKEDPSLSEKPRREVEEQIVDECGTVESELVGNVEG